MLQEGVSNLWFFWTSSNLVQNIPCVDHMIKNKLPDGGMWIREDYTEEDGKKRVKVSVPIFGSWHLWDNASTTWHQYVRNVIIGERRTWGYLCLCNLCDFLDWITTTTVEDETVHGVYVCGRYPILVYIFLASVSVFLDCINVMIHDTSVNIAHWKCPVEGEYCHEVCEECWMSSFCSLEGVSFIFYIIKGIRLEDFK